MNKTVLLNHLYQKYENLTWLQEVLANPNAPETKFPYHPNAGGVGYMSQREVTVVPYPGQYNPSANTPDSPVYLVEIPFYLPLDTVKAHTLFEEKMKLLRDQAFVPSAQSNTLVQDKIFVVIGANRRQSLSPTENDLFYENIKKLPKIKGIHYCVIGRLWEGSWTKKVNSNYLYSPEKASLLVKAHNSEIGNKIQKAFDESKVWKKQVPYQHLREWIKTHIFTEVVVNDVLSKNRLLYFTTMDSDFVALRSIFSYCDHLLLQWKQNHQGLDADLFSPGYFFPLTEDDIIRIGAIFDMMIRKALSQTFPMAVYYPEPFSLMRISSLDLFKQCSFYGGETNQQDMEGRFFVGNAKNAGAIDPARAFFEAIELLHILAPNRMKKGTTNGKKITSFNNLASDATTKSLRGVNQSILNPNKLAKAIYRTCPVTIPGQGKGVSYISTILNCFDPIHLAKSLPFSGKYSYKRMEKVLSTYENFSHRMYFAILSAENQNQLLDNVLPLFPSLKTVAEKNDFRTYFQTLLAKAYQAKLALKNGGANDEWITKVCQAAYFCGGAIAKGFEKIGQNL